VANNSPLSHALELGADRVYVLPTGATCELDEPPRAALAMLLYATHLLLGRRLADEIAVLSDRASVIVLPPPCPLRVQPTDFSHADELIDQARADSRRVLARLDRRRSSAMRPRRRPANRPRSRLACIQPGSAR
jgi:NTE family protein